MIVNKSKSEDLKHGIDSSWPKKGVTLSSESVDLLIEQLREIATASVCLIAEIESSKNESASIKWRARVLQWAVSIAFVIGCAAATFTSLIVHESMEYMKEEMNATAEAFKDLDKDVSLTLEVVRILSDAQASAVKADVDMSYDSEKEAHQLAIEAQHMATEAETKIQKDPLKRANAIKRLRSMKENEAPPAPSASN